MNGDMDFIWTILTRWLPSYPAEFVRRRPRPTHILFCLTDHYEPGTGQVDPQAEKARVTELLMKYPALADAHADASGRPPRRTWFFPPHYHRRGNLRELVSLCQRGYGEIEFHLHHGKTAPDTAEGLRRTIELSLRDYSRFGIFGTEAGTKRYGFIHGDYALNNSLPGGRWCGVDEELAILRETGCYADFTFPSCNASNPRQINGIYYADVSLQRPKSYATGTPVRAGAAPRAGAMEPTGDAGHLGAALRPGLLMIQGPVRPVWMEGRLTFGDVISDHRPPTKRLIDAWIATSIHVSGRPDWVIVKAHTHGAPNAAVVLGDPMHQAFTHLETAYNDGSSYVLHYVTARELYNIIRAAEAGEAGDPDQYRDYAVSPPRYDASPDILEASEELKEAFSRTYQG